MGLFTEFVKSKLEEQNAKKVSSNLLKNIIDVLKEYVLTEFDLSDDEKMQIINNLQIGVEEHNEGVLKNGPRFIATSNYDESEGEKVTVEIKIDIVTEKIEKKSEMNEPDESSDEIPDEAPVEEPEDGGEE